MYKYEIVACNSLKSIVQFRIIMAPSSLDVSTNIYQSMNSKNGIILNNAISPFELLTKNNTMHDNVGRFRTFCRCIAWGKTNVHHSRSFSRDVLLTTSWKLLIAIILLKVRNRKEEFVLQRTALYRS